MDLMTGESPGVPLDDDAFYTLLDRPFTELSTDELMALKDACAARGFRIYNRTSPEQVILAFIAGNFCSAYIQALAKRAESGVANLPKQVSDLVRKHIKRKGHPEEIRIGAGDEATATISLTASTPDEARLALLDLDVTAEEVRGKVLRWDHDATVWRADSTDD
jgi:hypothetical protein